jgi:HAD superfamily phosphoserine phosphatase-like hydrolase
LKGELPSDKGIAKAVISEIVAFDLDHTLLASNISAGYGKFLYRQGAFSRSTMLYLMTAYGFHLLGGSSIAALHRDLFGKIFFHRPAEPFLSHAEVFVDQLQDSEFFAPAVARLRAAQQSGHLVAILSSSPDFLVSRIAARLQVSYWCASSYEVDSLGRFSATGQLIQGVEKAEWIVRTAERLQIANEKITAYSDSLHDLPFLQAAGRPVAVRPGWRLVRLCRRYGWEVLS